MKTGKKILLYTCSGRATHLIPYWSCELTESNQKNLFSCFNISTSRCLNTTSSAEWWDFQTTTDSKLCTSARKCLLWFKIGLTSTATTRSMARSRTSMFLSYPAGATNNLRRNFEKLPRETSLASST